jgi:hypothetical protein
MLNQTAMRSLLPPVEVIFWITAGIAGLCSGMVGINESLQSGFTVRALALTISCLLMITSASFALYNEEPDELGLWGLIVITASLYRRVLRKSVLECRYSLIFAAVPKITAVITMKRRDT